MNTSKIDFKRTAINSTGYKIDSLDAILNKVDAKYGVLKRMFKSFHERYNVFVEEEDWLFMKQFVALCEKALLSKPIPDTNNCELQDRLIEQISNEIKNDIELTPANKEAYSKLISTIKLDDNIKSKFTTIIGEHIGNDIPRDTKTTTDTKPQQLLGSDGQRIKHTNNNKGSAHNRQTNRSVVRINANSASLIKKTRVLTSSKEPVAQQPLNILDRVTKKHFRREYDAKERSKLRHEKRVARATKRLKILSTVITAPFRLIFNNITKTIVGGLVRGIWNIGKFVTQSLFKIGKVVVKGVKTIFSKKFWEHGYGRFVLTALLTSPTLLFWTTTFFILAFRPIIGAISTIIGFAKTTYNLLSSVYANVAPVISSITHNISNAPNTFYRFLEQMLGYIVEDTEKIINIAMAGMYSIVVANITSDLIAKKTTGAIYSRILAWGAKYSVFRLCMGIQGESFDTITGMGNKYGSAMKSYIDTGQVLGEDGPARQLATRGIAEYRKWVTDMLERHKSNLETLRVAERTGLPPIGWDREGSKVMMDLEQGMKVLSEGRETPISKSDVQTPAQANALKLAAWASGGKTTADKYGGTVETMPHPGTGEQVGGEGIDQLCALYDETLREIRDAYDANPNAYQSPFNVPDLFRPDLDWKKPGAMAEKTKEDILAYPAITHILPDDGNIDPYGRKYMELDDFTDHRNIASKKLSPFTEGPSVTVYRTGSGTDGIKINSKWLFENAIPAIMNFEREDGVENDVEIVTEKKCNVIYIKDVYEVANTRAPDIFSKTLDNLKDGIRKVNLIPMFDKNGTRYFSVFDQYLDKELFIFFEADTTIYKYENIIAKHNKSRDIQLARMEEILGHKPEPEPEPKTKSEDVTPAEKSKDDAPPTDTQSSLDPRVETPNVWVPPTTVASLDDEYHGIFNMEAEQLSGRDTDPEIKQIIESLTPTRIANLFEYIKLLKMRNTNPTTTTAVAMTETVTNNYIPIINYGIVGGGNPQDPDCVKLKDMAYPSYTG